MKYYKVGCVSVVPHTSHEGSECRSENYNNKLLFSFLNRLAGKLRVIDYYHHYHFLSYGTSLFILNLQAEPKGKKKLSIITYRKMS